MLTYSVAFGVLAGVKAHAYSNYILGISLINQKRYDEAVEHFQKAVAIDQESAPFYMGLGRAYVKKARLDEAISNFQRSLELEPVNAGVQYDLGLSLIQAGRPGEAAVHIQKALEIDPGFVEAQDAVRNNNFAWSLATNPESSRRNGIIAIILAEGACRQTHNQVTAMVGTLAAAYAEAGRFDDAIATAQMACSMASQANDQKLLQTEQALLALYVKHQPCRENQSNPHQ